MTMIFVYLRDDLSGAVLFDINKSELRHNGRLGLFVSQDLTFDA